jgi:hypothetical protein
VPGGVKQRSGAFADVLVELEPQAERSVGTRMK